jgi:ribosomal protein S18 acetylase RimI-like enzyme
MIGEPIGTLRAGYRIRIANTSDAGAVRQLDDLCFPPESPDKQRADPGELEEAVRVGDVRLLESGDDPMGYLHVDTTVPGRIYVSGLAVHPQAQRQGLGTIMVEECLASIGSFARSSVPIVTVTSPRNLPMLRVSFTHGFGARWVLRDFFGPGPAA